MDDGGLIDNGDLRSTRMRAREVRGEVLTGPERRRRWSVEEKVRILAQSAAPGASVMLVCRMHGISSGQLYTWRRQFRTSELTGFVPVMVSPAVGELPAASASAEAAPDQPAGVIEVELRSGVKLRLTGAVDTVVCGSAWNKAPVYGVIGIQPIGCRSGVPVPCRLTPCQIVGKRLASVIHEIGGGGAHHGGMQLL
jgi:transposase